MDLLEKIANFNIFKKLSDNKKSYSEKNNKVLLLEKIFFFKFDDNTLSQLKDSLLDLEFKKDLIKGYDNLLSQIEKKERVVPDIILDKYIYEIINLYDKDLLKYLILIISYHNMGLFYISKILGTIDDKEKIKTILEIIVESDFKIIKNINYFESIYINNIFRVENITINNEFKNVLGTLLYFLISPFFSDVIDVRNLVKEKIGIYLNKLRESFFATIREKIIVFLENSNINRKDSFTSLLELCYYDIIIFSETDQQLRDIIVKINENKKENEEAYFKFICDELDSFLNLSYKKYSHKIISNFKNILELSEFIFDNNNYDFKKISFLFEGIDPFIQNIINNIFQLSFSKEINLDLDQKREKILRLLMERNKNSETNEIDTLKPLEDVFDVYNPDEVFDKVEVEVKEEKNITIPVHKEEVTKNNNETKKSEYDIVIDIFNELKGNFNLNSEEDIKKIKEFIHDVISEKNKRMNKKRVIEEAIKDSLDSEDFESL